MTGTRKLYDSPAVCETYFFPQRHRPLRTGKDAGPLDLFLGDGTRIGCYWSRPLVDAPTMLYLHGNGECIADQLDRWPEWARLIECNIFFVDYPGYASSDGEPTFSSCCEAASAALRHLLAKPEVSSVLVMGRSVGSIFALDAAYRSSSALTRGLILESGIADLRPRLDMRVSYEERGLSRAAIHRELEEDFDHRNKFFSSRCSPRVSVRL